MIEPPTTLKEVEVFYPKNQTEWRKWLEENHLLKQSVWVVFHSKASGKLSLTWSESVDEALCFGWIDSKKIKVDHETSHQFFSKRKAQSTWSKINKEKVERLIAEGRMSPAGHESIARAKNNGSWTILDEVEALLIPDDLKKAFSHHPGAEDYFLGLSKSVRKMMLSWIVLAKRTETRQSRIDQIAEAAGKGMKLKPF